MLVIPPLGYIRETVIPRENVFVKDEKIDLIDKNLKNFVPFKTLNDQTAGGSK